MADIEAVEVLTQAKERLFACGWATGPRTTRKSDVPLCLEESLLALDSPYGFVSCLSPWVDQDIPRIRAAGYVRDAIGDWNPPDYVVGVQDKFKIFQWNDEQKSAGVVFDVVDRAIEIAKEAPTPAS